MALIVVWSDQAKGQLDSLIEYLTYNWTAKEIHSFFVKLEKAIKIIQTKSLQQKQSIRKKGTFEYQITKHTTLFYSFDSHSVYILVLWANKKDPKKLK